MTPYASADELKAELQADNVAFTRDDALYAALVEEASEAIDRFCLRTFAVPTQATARLYRPTRDGCEVFELDDIASTAGLVVAVDTTDSGSFTTLSSGDWWAEVDNVTGMVDAIHATGRFPRSSAGRPTVEVTARYGWPTVPGPIHRACLLWARRLYTRKDSPAGVLGFGDMGAVRLSAMDPDVQSLCAPYRRIGRLVA